MTDLVERARTIALAIDFSPDDLGGSIGTASLRNPDGKELLSIVEALSERIAVQREVLERAAENFERLTVPHIVGNEVHNFAFQAAKLIRQSLTQEPQ